jgi:small subunit ribosomal protein S9
MSENLVEFLGTGRRKTSVARVRISTGTGKIVVNGKPFEECCRQEVTQQMVLSPLKVADISEKVDAHIHVFGRGVSGQAEAIRLGIARALCEMDIGLRTALKKAGYLRRDGRKKERKRPGQPGLGNDFNFPNVSLILFYFYFSVKKREALLLGRGLFYFFIIDIQVDFKKELGFLWSEVE